MTIQANVEGVGTLQFPDGTDPAIIKATVQKQIAAKQSAAPAGGAAAQPGFPFSSVSTLKPGNRLPKLDAPELGDAKKDWKEGLTFYDNVALDNADNLREKQKYLNVVYGEKNVKIATDGSIAVMKDGKWVSATGPSKPKSALAEITAATPITTGMAIGAKAGLEAGASTRNPWGMALYSIGGAVLGAVTAKSAQEAQKAISGTLDKTPAETVRAYGDTALGAAGGELAATGIGKAISRIARGPLPKFATQVTPETNAMTDRVIAAGARPPAQSTLPGLKHVQWMETFAAKIGGANKAADTANAAYIQRRISGILENSGVAKSDVAPTIRELANPDSKIPTAEVGEQIKKSVTAHKDMIQGQVDQGLSDAQKLLDAQTSRLAKMTRAHATEGLATDVATGIKESRKDFGTSMSKVYQKVDSMVGDKALVPTAIINKEAQSILKRAPQSVQAQLTKELADIGIDLGQTKKAISFADAQRIRTILRERSDEGSLTRGATEGEFARLANAVDHAIQAAAKYPEAAPAVKMLNKADELYHAGIRKFDDATVKRLVTDMRAGIEPNPETVAAKILKPDNVARVKEIRRLVGKDAWQKVAGADYTNLITHATDETGAVNGMKLLRGVTERKALMTEIYGAKTANEITELAKSMASRDGGLPVEALAPGQIRTTLANVRAEEAKLNEFMKTNALSSLTNPKINPERAYKWLTQPNNGTALKGAIKLLGEGSPQIAALRQTALKEVLTNAKVEVASGTPSDALTKALNKYPTEQQKLLFPNGMAEDLHLLGREIKFTMAKLQDESMAGFGAGAVLSPATPFFVRIPIQFGMGIYTAIASNPTTIRYLAMGLRSPSGAVRNATRETIKQLVRTGALSPTMGGEEP